MALYRVLNPSGGPISLPTGAKVEETYDAFVVISATEKVAEELRKSYPVEKLDRPDTSPKPKGPKKRGMLAMKTGGGDASKGWPRDMVVRFKSAVQTDWLKELGNQKASVVRALGSSSVVASVSSQAALNAVRDNDKVEQVDDHVPDIRITPEFFLGTVDSKTDDKAVGRAAARLASGAVTPTSGKSVGVPNTVIASFLTKDACANAKKILAKQKHTDVYDGGESKLIISLNEDADRKDALGKIVEIPGLLRLDEKKMLHLYNNVARGVIGQGVVSANPGGLNLTGKNEVASVADTGLDTGDPTTIHSDFKGRIKDMKSFPIAPSWNTWVTNPGGDDGPGDLYSGHGTHTTGSVLGDGSRSTTLGVTPPVQGLAPEAKLVFQAIEQTAKWTNSSKLWFLQRGMKPPVSGLYGIPDDLRDLFQAAYDQGARIHSNSWGGGDPGAYDPQSEAVDHFVWDNRDMLILFAAGNDGTEVKPGGKTIAPGSVTPPATSKNCLTVGASENNRPTDFTDTYGAWWPDDFPNGGINVDPMTDNINDIVAFSSRGPCLTGRRKPDVVAPGTFVLSTRSSKIAANNFGWAAFPPAKQDYMYDGGTSMATPLVAGAAVLVREYLRQTAGISKPTAALMKAALIHSAQYNVYQFADPSSGAYADDEQGWGRVTLKNVLAPASPAKVIFQDEGQGLATGQASTLKIQLTGSTVPLRVTMVYSDYPGENLINNLNLMVTDPSGKFYLGNDFAGNQTTDSLNNVEGVVIPTPASGVWSVSVVASEVQQGPQTFALVVSGEGAVNAAAPATPAATPKAAKPKVKKAPKAVKHKKKA